MFKRIQRKREKKSSQTYKDKTRQDKMERVLVIGATGNIGVSVCIAALRSKREVLAVVRNQAAAEKLYRHVGTKTGITTVEGDITGEDGVQKVVDQVKAGSLPSFQHVYAAGQYDHCLRPLAYEASIYQRDALFREFPD